MYIYIYIFSNFSNFGVKRDVIHICDYKNIYINDEYKRLIKTWIFEVFYSLLIIQSCELELTKKEEKNL